MKKVMSEANGFRLLEPLPHFGINEGERSDAGINPAHPKPGFFHLWSFGGACFSKAEKMKKVMSEANGFRLLEPLPHFGINEGERSDAGINPAHPKPGFFHLWSFGGASFSKAEKMKKVMSEANGFRLLEPLPHFGINEGERSDAGINPAHPKPGFFHLWSFGGASFSKAEKMKKVMSEANGFRLLEPLPHFGINEGERSDAGVPG
ncbi:hypothetical protein [Anseongella ginsenosidimutans]|uniref:hypothetical protein n=1 Tax=Anseongella ginsenosidimutans TaxID=496056 RepID=UPI0011C9A232|nr:hypothetical protein [Anseongella ginsenosidimutans]QEC50932.1 hypothetical protein FRZ59_00225 [Anseongella ginsenosidimutans]